MNYVVEGRDSDASLQDGSIKHLAYLLYREELYKQCYDECWEEWGEVQPLMQSNSETTVLS